MDKRQFFIEAMQAGCYKYREWILSAFTVTKINPKRTRRGRVLKYDYQIVGFEESMLDEEYKI